MLLWFIWTKNLKKFNNVKASRYNFFYKITKDLLLIIGCRVLSIINADKYNLIRTITAPDSSCICVSYMLSKNIFLTRDFIYNIKKCKIDGDNIIINFNRRICP